MKKIFLASAIVALIGAPSFAEPRLVKATSVTGQTMDAIAGQVIVKYRKGKSAHAQSRLKNSVSFKSLKTMGPLEAEVLKVPAGETIDSFIRTLKSDPDVEFAEPNGIVRSNFTPDDPQLSNQYYLNSSKLNMAAAWDISQGSSTVIIAVLDTGSLYTQAEFSGQYVPGFGTTMGIDWDGDGNYSDTSTCAQNCAGNDQSPGAPPLDDNFDECSESCQDSGLGSTGIYHGTRVSSIIGSVTNNTSGMAGIAPNCKLMAVKVLNNKGVGPFDSVANGIVWATTSGAKVINMSLGSRASSSLLDSAVQYALQNDVVVVAASGNAGIKGPCAVEYPGAIPGVIAVGATNSSDALANFSCTGSNLDLVAPGVSIRTLTSDSGGIATSFTDLSGTSFSSPMVAAVAGLIRSRVSTLTYRQVTQYLDNFADDLGSSGFDTAYGFGRLNAYRSLAAVASQTPPSSDNGSPGKTYPAPNPFRPHQGPVIFYLPSTLGTQGIEIDIFNIGGEKIKSLNSGCLVSGQCQWDGRNDDGNFVASGFYLYRVKTSGGEMTGKLTVVK